MFCADAQDAGKSAPTEEIPVRSYTLEFGKPVKTGLGSGGAVMSAMHTCGEDGTVFLEVRDNQADGIGPMTLHSLDREGQTVRFVPGHVPGYADEISHPLRFFSGETRVAALVNATPVKASVSDPEPDPVKLALIYDRKGALQKAVRLPNDGLDVTAVGLYDSGNLLVVGANTEDHSARLLVVSEAGDTVRELRLFDEDYNLRNGAKEDQMLSGIVNNRSGALQMMQVVAHGHDLLLIPVYTRQPILEVNEQGVVHVYRLKIPDGFFLAEPLSLGKQSWSFESSGGGFKEPKQGETATKMFVINPGPVLVFSPFDDSLLREVSKPLDSSKAVLVCEQDGEYTALTTDRADGALEVMKASIPH
jgi:hypothetical protein